MREIPGSYLQMEIANGLSTGHFHDVIGERVFEAAHMHTNKMWAV